MRGAASVISIRAPDALDLVQSLLAQGVSVRISVSGSSMLPLITCGATVEVVPFAGTPPQPGDIILLCGRQNNPLVHRLIWRRRRNGVLYLLTKGDACAGFDGFIPAEQALGRVGRIILPDSSGRAEKAISLSTPCQRLRASLTAQCAVLRHLVNSR